MKNNSKSTEWAALVGSPAISEAVQRIAFTFGYRWITTHDKVNHTDAPVLIFNSANKVISYESKSVGLSEKVCKVCVCLDEVIQTFQNPPTEVSESRETLENGTTVFSDGSVLFRKYKLSKETVALTSPDIDEMISVRNKLLGKEEKKSVSPVVRFRYASPSSGQNLRKLMVLEDSVDSYSGLDMEDGNSFKRFRKDRIVGGVMFVGLSEVKN